MKDVIGTIKAKIKMELSFEHTDWQEIKLWAERAAWLEDSEGYTHGEKYDSRVGAKRAG